MILLYVMNTAHYYPCFSLVSESPQLISGSNPLIVNQSQSTNLTCVFLSRPIPAIVWTVHTTPPTTVMDDDSKYNIFTFNTIQADGVSIRTTSLLEINNLVTNDTQNYTCTATNTPLTTQESTDYLIPLLVQSKQHSH